MLSYTELLAKVYEDEYVEKVLESMGCHNIRHEQGGSLITCARPDGDNVRSIQIKIDEELKGVIHTRGVSGNLFDIVAYNENIDLYKAKEYIMCVCGYNENTKYVESPLAWLNKVKRKRKKYQFDYDINILDEKILNQYIYGDIKQFNDDNISTETLLKYKVGFDTITQRITIPIYDIYGNLSGVKGRATREQDMDYKFYFLYQTDQSKTLFNYHNAKPYCIERGKVYVFESEKAPMQGNEFGLYNAVGIGSSGISYEQLNLLLDLGCDIVLCYDKSLDMDKIYERYINFFRGKRAVWTVEDNEEDCLLEDKDSPVDKDFEVWMELDKNKRRII